MSAAPPGAAWRKPLLLGVASVAFALGLLFAGMRLIEGQSMPNTRLATLAGAPIALPTVAPGRPTVVNLWATWCPPCRLELPFLASAQQQDASIGFIFVDQGEDAATIQRYLASANLALGNVLIDPGGRLGRELGASALPVTLFYDAGGRMVDSHLGALSPATLAEKLSRLRSTGAPRPR